MSTDDGPLLSRVQDSLRPYIRDRQEALRIRRVLSAYLESFVGGSSDSIIYPITLAAPNRDAFVKAIPTELSGVRKAYLLALRANIKARQKYEHTAQGLGSDNETITDIEQRRHGELQGQSVPTYLDLLELQRKYEKLKVLQDYLGVLRKKEPANKYFLSIDSIRQEANANDDLVPALASRPAVNMPEKDTQSQVLITRLEKAVLSANETVKREKRLLEELKASQDSETLDNLSRLPPSIRVRALARTRDELVSWIEQQLAKVDEVGNTSRDESSRRGADNRIDIGQRRKEIQKTYEDYLGVRRSIVDLLANRMVVQKIDYKQKQKEPKPPEESENRHHQPSKSASLILPYISERLIPAADAQKALRQEEVHLANGLKAKMRSMNKKLDRLADESHLLSNYPLLALQPRFKGTVAALGGSNLSPSPLGDSIPMTEELKIANHAKAWAFAADAARSTLNSGLEERLRRGEQHAAAAEKTLEELQDLVGIEDDATSSRETHDLWNSSEGQTASGVWAGLDGTIGTSSTAR